MANSNASALTLTEEFRDALKLLEADSHLFLTGKAGTGKSTLIRLFTETTDKNLVVAAPTGVAALNVDGYTLHRLFSFPAGVSPEFVQSAQYFPRRFGKILKSLDTLIIDEASMIRADLLDSISIALRRFGPKPDRPFGGVQIVLVGDLYQLPPVVLDAEHEYFSTVYGSPYFFAGMAYDQVEFPTVELTTIFRQDGDPQFVSMLNSIRDGQATPQVVELLNDNVGANFVPNADEFWLTLTTTNRVANARNKTKLDALTSEPFISQAMTTGELDNFDTPTQDHLAFKVGAQIMLLTNDHANRWVNGSLAVIIDIMKSEGEYRIEVELRNGERHIIERHTWEITRPTTNAGKLSHEVIGTFRQLPFRLAWAVTVHKAQGLTLDRCIVDFAGGAFADGQLYVALSRARSLDGLVLARPIRPRDLRVNQHIRRFHHTHAGGDQGEPVVIAASFVGDEGFQWRPRPIELAAILPDGTELSTLVDPQRDIGNAATTLDISAEDVALAPTLPQAWSAMAPYLAGHIPVGYRLSETLEFIDYELKRHEQIIQIPIGIDIHPVASEGIQAQLDQSLPAIEKARIIKGVLDGTTKKLPPATVFNGDWHRFGYLLPRSSSRVVRFLIDPHDTEDLTKYLGTLAQGAKNSTRLLSTLRAVEQTTDYMIFDDNFESERTSMTEVMQNGLTLCFTGEARDPKTGAYIERSELEEKAAAKGLTSEDSLTKSRTDVLIVAEFGTQSGKAKKARQWGKPIFSVEEFLDWVDGNAASTPHESSQEMTVLFEELPIRKDAAAIHTTAQAYETATVEAFGETFPKDNAAQRYSVSSENALPSMAEASVTDQVPADVLENVRIPWSAEPIGKYLTEGARVSVTGTVYHPDDKRRILQSEIAQILAAHGFEYVRNLTQQGTTMLLVGNVQNITRQIATAANYEKPIFSSDDFFTWLAHTKITEEPPQYHRTEPGAAMGPAPAPPPPEHPESNVEPLGRYPADIEPVQTINPTNPTGGPPKSRSQASRPAYPKTKRDSSRPIWVRMSNRNFYTLAAVVPLGLMLVVPVLLALIGVMTGIAAIVMLIGMLSVPVAIVFVALRIRGRRRWKRTTVGNRQRRS